jgi:hypothetical protein
VGSIGVHVSITWSWVDSFTAAISPLVPNFLKPGLRLYCIIMYAHTLILSSDVVHDSQSILCVTLSIILSRDANVDVLVGISGQNSEEFWFFSNSGPFFLIFVGIYFF